MIDNPFARHLADWIELKSRVRRVRLEYGGKHPKLVWESPASGNERAYVCPGSPSDNCRGRLNAKKDVERWLRADGDWIETEKEISEARARREALRLESMKRQRDHLLEQAAALDELLAERAA